MTVDLFCSYPTHAQHSDQTGWNDGPLATGSLPIDGMICEGCATYDNDHRVNAPATITVQVDPQALADAQTAVSQATTVAGLRAAVLGALDLLNPSG